MSENGESDDESKGEGRSVGWFTSDDVAQPPEEEINPTVTKALRCAQRKLLRPGAAKSPYRAAFRCVAPVLHDRMAPSQRLRVLFIVAVALAAEEPNAAALEPVDEALELAIQLNVTRAIPDLLLLRASINRAILQVPDASEDLHLCLDLFAALAGEHGLSRANLETKLDVTLHLAGSEFLLGHPEETQHLLEAATQLMSAGSGTELQKALVYWTKSLLLRWQGDLEPALTQAMIAADVYSREGHPGSASRIAGVVAEIALDLAERLQHTGYHRAANAFLLLAAPYVDQAIALAQQGDYQSSEVMARIVQARHALLSGAPGDRKPQLEAWASQAWSERDMAVVAQAYTMLGKECEAQSDREAARAWYEKTLAVLTESKMAALGVWAQRALWRLGEY